MSTPFSSVATETPLTLSNVTAQKAPATAVSGRLFLKIQNIDAATDESPGAVIYWGFSSSVTPANGTAIAAGESSVWLPTAGAVWVISNTNNSKAMARELS